MTFPATLTQMLSTFRLVPYPSVTDPPQPVTVKSLAEFLFAMVWACLILVSFTGWGRFLAKLLRVQRIPTSVACALGIAVIVFIGGWLNLVHAIYTTVLIALIGTGFLLYLMLRKERPDTYRWLEFWKHTPRWSRVVLALTLLILALRVAATVRLGSYNTYDDGTAYLAFPEKMLAAHRFAPDPFSDRRVISSLGGSYLLQAIVIAPTSLSNIGMADRTLGFLLMFTALFDLGVAFELSAERICFMVFVAYLVPQETFNLTFIVLPISLFLAMMWPIFESLKYRSEDRWRYALAAGFIGGGILGLKSTFLPYAGAVALFPYLVFFWNHKKSEACKLPLIAGIATLVVVASWMVAMRYESGTFLFPLLGHGVDYSSYGPLPQLAKFSGSRAVVRVFLQGSVLLMLAAVQYFSRLREEKARFSFSILLAAAFAITAFNFESGGDYIWRYNFPQFFTALVVFFAAASSALSITAASAGASLTRYLAVVSFVACIFYYDVSGGYLDPFHQMDQEMLQYPCDLNASLSGRKLVSPEMQLRYRAIASVLPPNSISLDDTARTFLLQEHSGKRFLIDDWPGAAGPPPGWPYSGSPEAVTEYLAQNSVRYIIFDYAYASWVDMRSCQALVNQTHYSQLDHALELLTFVTHHQFNQLRATHRSLYDDGRIAVVDLTSPVADKPEPESSWMLNTSETKMCSEIAQSYTSTHTSYPVSQKPDTCQ